MPCIDCKNISIIITMISKQHMIYELIILQYYYFHNNIAKKLNLEYETAQILIINKIYSNLNIKKN